MRPQRERKRANYVEHSPSPEAEDIDHFSTAPASPSRSDRSMQSSGPFRKRVRYSSAHESPQQHHHHQQHPTQRSNLAGFPMALPQPFSTPPPAAPSYTSYANADERSPAVPFVVQTPPQQQPLPLAQHPATANRHSLLSGMSLGGSSMSAAGLSIPLGAGAAELQRREAEVVAAMHRFEREAPALPPSSVADLPPKPHPETWLAFPAGISKEERLAIERENNRIATRVQKIERERNNLAAKKSRRKRLEALDNTRAMLNAAFAELSWWRLRAAALGAQAGDWDAVPEHTKKGMLRDIETRIKQVDEENEQYRKVEDAKKRAERNKTRAALKAKRNNAD